MQLNITGNHIELTDALKAFTEKKFSRLKAYRDSIISTHVTFNVENRSQIAEAQIHIPGHTIFAKAEHDDLYTAIDALIDKLHKQLKKYKELEREHD